MSIFVSARDGGSTRAMGENSRPRGMLECREQASRVFRTGSMRWWRSWCWLDKTLLRPEVQQLPFIPESWKEALTVTYKTIAVSKSKPREMSSPKQHRQVPGHWGIFGRVRRGKQRTYRHEAEVQKERVRLFTRVQDVGWRQRRDLLLFDFSCVQEN